MKSLPKNKKQNIIVRKALLLPPHLFTEKQHQAYHNSTKYSFTFQINQINNTQLKFNH